MTAKDTALIICMLATLILESHKTQINLSYKYIHPPLSQFVTGLI